VASDVARYFDKIGYAGPFTPTRDVLARIALAHTTTIPFENLDPLAGKIVALDVPSLFGKLVEERRGGYCFEHNLLLVHALEDLGFRVKPLAARVRYNVPPDAVTPRSHMLVLVREGGEDLVVDVGFGGLTLTGVLRLGTTEPQTTPHERFRFVREPEAEDIVMEAEVGGAWKPLYRFDLQRQHAVDYAVTSHFLCTSPTSHFRRTVIAARATPNGRFALRDTALSAYRNDGTLEKRTLASAAEIRAALEGPFGIAVPHDGALEGAFTDAVLRSSPTA